MLGTFTRRAGRRSSSKLLAKRGVGGDYLSTRSRSAGRHKAVLDVLEQRLLLSVSVINSGGLGYVGNGSGGPPDVTGAAGPDSYLEITNDTVTLFSPKLGDPITGGTILDQHSIYDFFYNPAIGNQTRIYSQTVNVAASPTGATESGTTVTITTTAAHGFVVGQSVSISGVGVGGYNGNATITGTPTATSFTYTASAAGLADSGGGTVKAQSRGVADSTGIFDNLMGIDGRFIIGNIDVETVRNVSQYIFAVSTSSSPTAFDAANWNFYHITTTEGPSGSSQWTDYPGNPGFNADAFVETFDMFGGTRHTQVITVDASDLANGVSQASLHYYSNDVPGGGQVYRATTMHDSVSGDPMWLIQNPNDGANLNVTKMTNILSNSATFTSTTLALPAGATFTTSGSISNPLNPDGTGMFDVGSRILKAGEYNDVIVAAHTVDVTTGNRSLSSAQANDKNGNPLGGSGYTVGDALTINGGTFTTAAQVTVASVAAGGRVATVSVSTAGSYSDISGVDGTVTGGSGTGARFSLFFTGQLAAQWYAVDVSSGTPAFQKVGGVDNVGRVAFGPNTYAYEPAIDINASGEIGLGFMESDTVGGAADPASGGYISTFVTARRDTDPAGTMQSVVLVQAGTGTGNINSRIGDFSGMNVDPVNGTFWHVNEFGGGGPTAIANFTPEDRPVLTAPSDQVAVEGTAKLFDLGSLSDADGSPWTIEINWGDGTAHSVFTTGTAGALGTLSHTYAEESAAEHPGSNPYVVLVTVTDFTNLSDTQSFNVTVSDPAVVATGGFVVNAVEGAASGYQTVATFTDPGGAEALSHYAATISWGDGAATNGSISYSAGVFTVQGNHTYAEESAVDHAGSNPYAITVTIGHESTTPQVVMSSAAVSDPAVAGTGGFAFAAVEGTPSAVQTVATFTDPGGPEALADYSALIDWGDGTPATVGLISGPDGSNVYTVQGSHTYATGTGQPDEFGNTFCGAVPPYYHRTITVTLLHEAATPTVVHDTATISLPPASAHLAGGSLIVVGTTLDDHVVINPVGHTGMVDVKLNSMDLGSFGLGVDGRIIVATIAGSDNIQIAGGVTLDTVLYGGPGNDRIKGGGGSNIEVGCAGDDELIAGRFGDLLIGGEGADRLIGGAGNDILIAGTTVDSVTHMEDVVFSHLVSILNGGTVTALDDGALDFLNGGAGIDLFYSHQTGGGVLDKLVGKVEQQVNI